MNYHYNYIQIKFVLCNAHTKILFLYINVYVPSNYNQNTDYIHLPILFSVANSINHSFLTLFAV